jgi:hypothetical protein
LPPRQTSDLRQDRGDIHLHLGSGQSNKDRLDHGELLVGQASDQGSE